MKRFFDQELRVLQAHITEMGEKAIEQVKLSIRALMEGDIELAARVKAQDDRLDALEMEIDSEAIRYISLRFPVARELRLVVVGMKAGGDLERVGDEAANIAKQVENIGSAPHAGPIRDDLAKMAALVIEMLRDALDSLLEGDEEKALSICKRDEEIDHLNKRMHEGLLFRMTTEPENVSTALELIFVSRALERIADHATNLAEEVIFLLRARDIRHRGIAREGVS